MGKALTSDRDNVGVKRRVEDHGVHGTHQAVFITHSLVRPDVMDPNGVEGKDAGTSYHNPGHEKDAAALEGMKIMSKWD